MSRDNGQIRTLSDESDGSHEEDELPMFPPSEEMGLTFQVHGKFLSFFVLPPNNDLQEKEHASLVHLIEKGGGIASLRPSRKTYNVCYHEKTLIPRHYATYKTWYTADLIRRCIDCQSFEEDIVEAEMILAPNFQGIADDQPAHEDEWCSDEVPDLDWRPEDLFFSMELIRPVMGISADQYSRLSSGPLLQADPSKVRGRTTTKVVDVDGDDEMDGGNSKRHPVVKLEDIIDEPITSPVADSLILRSSGMSETLRRPSRKALQTYIRNRQKWCHLLDRLPHHDLVFLQRVSDLLSGDLEEVHFQVSCHGEDFEMIKNQPGRWDSRHDKYLSDGKGSAELAQYSVEQKFSRKKYLEETMTVNKVAANWLAKFEPIKYVHPIHATNSSHHTHTNN